MTQLSTTDFFLGFFAALRDLGSDAIRVRDDEHQKRFQQIAEFLNKSSRYPYFVPNPYTGRYQELDDALLQLQTGILGAKNPYYPEINIEISQAVARQILKEQLREDRELFYQLADKFRSAAVVEATA